MTEFAVGAASLSLLLLGMLALGGYQEVDRRSVVAARQLAWQDSWLMAAADPAARVRQIHHAHFSDSGTLDPAGRLLLVGDDRLELEAGRAPPTGLAGTTAQALLLPLRTASGFLGAGFDLDESGLARGVVRAHIGPLRGMPAPFSTLELSLQTPYALLGDAWHAAGSTHVRARAAGLVPTGRLAAISNLWGPLSVPLGLLEPSLRGLCPGVIEPDRIPEDRLGPGHTPLPGACQ